MRYEQVIEGCFGTGERALDRDAFADVLARTAPALEGLAASRATLPLLTLPEARDDLIALEPLAARLRGSFRHVVILGTGGSSLGGRAVTALAEGGDGPRLHFMDNIDPASFETLFAAAAPAETAYLVISKSGGTAETVAQFLIARAVMAAALGEKAPARHFTVVTEPRDNPLRRLAARDGIEVLDHDPRLGGRYSVLSLVGLLPAMIAGLDWKGVRAGAHEVLARTVAAETPAAAPPAVGAALNVALMRARGASISVLMPYADRLLPFAWWHRQLWAESLGKKGMGTTPAPALGAVDQHSQLQLYLDGPDDKFFTFLLLARRGTGRRVETAGDGALAYLSGRTMGDLLEAEQRATVETLAGSGRPVRVFRMERLDEPTLGALMMHFMLETVIAAHLLGVDPFDQPAVEHGKVLARTYLSEMSPS